MKTITTQELDLLKDHLIKKPFKYQEVYNEVLDHYATAFEQSNKSLNEVITEMDEEFPDHRIHIINSKYLDDLRKQLRKSHWAIFLGNFQWPQIIYTSLMGLVCIGIAPLLTQSEWAIYPFFLILAFTPIVLGFYYYLFWAIKKWRGVSKLKNGHAELFGTVFGISVIYIQLPNVVSAFVSSDIDLLMYNDLLTALILFIGVIMAFSAISFAKIKLKPAIV